LSAQTPNPKRGLAKLVLLRPFTNPMGRFFGSARQAGEKVAEAVREGKSLAQIRKKEFEATVKYEQEVDAQARYILALENSGLTQEAMLQRRTTCVRAKWATVLAATLFFAWTLALLVSGHGFNQKLWAAVCGVSCCYSLVRAFSFILHAEQITRESLISGRTLIKEIGWPGVVNKLFS